jgi:hypothetical protein
MARKKRKATKKSQELTWEQLNDQDKADEVKYSIKGDFELNSKLAHPKFGVGFVQKILDTTKIEVLFEDKSRVLIQNVA